MDTFDLVVVGSGGGALTGAALAAKAGLSVVVLEKTSLLGGTSAYSGGACWLPGSDVQQRAGLPDSTDGARTYLEAILEPPDDRRRAQLDAFLVHAPELVALLESDPAVDFEWLPFPEYYDAPGRVPMGRSIQPVKIRRDELSPEVAALVRPPVELDRAGLPGRRTLTGGQALIARLATILLREGGTVLTEHDVTALDVDGDRVVGVRGDGFGIAAHRGVLLAAGGFEGDAAARASRGVPGDVAWSMAPCGANTGAPIEAALAVGAAADFSALGWFCPGLAQPDGGGSFTLGFRSGLMVDATGRRYGNESLPYDRFGRLMAQARERVPSWYVFDSREDGRLPAIAMPEGEPADHLAAGTWVTASSVSELASAMGVPASALEATVERFNGFCEAGTDDDFGRGADEYDTFFGGGLIGVDQPPYYAARFVLSDLGTKGGLLTDAAGRVLRADGTAIAGLYASSNTTASMFGSVYPGPGAPLGSAMVLASLAVRDLLEG